MFCSTIASNAIRQRINDLYWNEGKSIKDIADILNMTYIRVYRYLKLKVKGYEPKPLRKRFNKQKQVNISHLLFDLGFSKPQIGRYLGVSPTAIYQYLKKENIQKDIVKVEIELLKDMNDEYENKVIIPSGDYLLYGGVKNNCLMIRNANNKGRLYFVNRDTLIGNFQITIGGEVLKPC